MRMVPLFQNNWLLPGDARVVFIIVPELDITTQEVSRHLPTSLEPSPMNLDTISFMFFFEKDTYSGYAVFIPMSVNAKVSSILSEIGEILTIKGDRFRSRAYNMAAQRIRGLTEDIREIKERDELQNIPGIGKSIAKTIKEYLETDESKVLQELRESLPRGVLEMIELEGIGPKNALRLHHELNIVSLETLEEAAKNQQIRKLKGFGPTKEANILKAIQEYRQRSTRFLLGEVLPVIQGILTYMKTNKDVRYVEVAGSARRRKETVGDLDILVSSNDPEEVTRHFVTMPPLLRVLGQGPTKSSIILKNMLQVDLRVIPPESYGAALQYFTGSKEHNVKLRGIGVKAGLKLNEYGLYNRENDELIEAEDESKIYDELGMKWMPPELREETGEIEAAIQDKLPNLIEYNDIKGDLHLHSNWSDGKTDIETMIQKAIQMKHQYIAITDHTKRLAITNGLDEKRLLKQMKEIDALNEKYPEINVLKGTEVDILRDGSLDISDEVLRELDWVVASVHSSFKLTEDEMTERIVAAIHNQYVNTIGHPTGRLIQKRSPYQLNIDRVLDAAAEQNVAMEINCFPDRLDLNDVNSRRAMEKNVLLTLGSDAHAPTEMELLPLGVSVARRGWLESKNIVNTLDVKKVVKLR